MVEVQIEVSNMVVDVVYDGLQVCAEAGISIEKGALSFLKVSEGVMDIENRVVGVMSSLKDDF